MEFAEALKLAMDGESQGALARRTGLTQAAISRYLAGARTPGMREIDALDAALPRLRPLRLQKRQSVA